MKDLLKRLLGRKRMTSEDVVNKLRQRGAKVGEDVTVFSPSTTFIDGTCAHLLTIGDHVGIAMGARILTHDYSWSVLKRYASDAVCEGGILGAQSPVEIGDSEEIYKNHLHPYTEALLSSVPIPDPDLAKEKEPIILQGDIPSPIAPPSGCRFRTRCPYAMDICAKEEPCMVNVGENHSVACHRVNIDKSVK